MFYCLQYEVYMFKIFMLSAVNKEKRTEPPPVNIILPFYKLYKLTKQSTVFYYFFKLCFSLRLIM